PFNAPHSRPQLRARPARRSSDLHLGAGHRRGRCRPGRERLHPMNGHGKMGETAPGDTTELCTWTLDAERDLWRLGIVVAEDDIPDRKSTRLNSSHVSRSYAVFCL